jgi:hypothetical protein
MNLDQQIHSIVSRVATEIAHAVRSDVASQIQRALNGGLSAPGRRPGRPKGVKATPAKAPKPGRKRGRGVDQRSLDTVYQFVARNPGRRSEEIQKSAGVPAGLAKKALVKLRETGRVRMRGVKRAATYAAA